MPSNQNGHNNDIRLCCFLGIDYPCTWMMPLLLTGHRLLQYVNDAPAANWRQETLRCSLLQKAVVSSEQTPSVFMGMDGLNQAVCTCVLFLYLALWLDPGKCAELSLSGSCPNEHVCMQPVYSVGPHADKYADSFGKAQLHRNCSH